MAESVNAIKDNKIEGFFWVGGLPTAAVTDLAATPNTKLVIVPTDITRALGGLSVLFDGLKK